MRWQLITDSFHPACGEHGLFGSRKLDRGEHVIDYLGYVPLRGNESQTSDYSVGHVAVPVDPGFSQLTPRLLSTLESTI